MPFVVAGLLASACSSAPPRSGAHGVAMSCAAPQLVVGAFPHTPIPIVRRVVKVHPGQTLTLRGRFYLADCYDTGQRGHPPVIETVQVVFAAPGGRRTALASVHPSGSLGRFKTAVIVPRAAHPGRSRILVAPAAPLPVLVVGRG